MVTGAEYLSQGLPEVQRVWGWEGGNDTDNDKIHVI